MVPDKQISLRNKILNAIFIVFVVATPFFIWRGIEKNKIVAVPPDTVNLDFPLSGGRFYVAFSGPGDSLYGAIHGAPIEKYALDIIKDTGNPDIFGVQGSLPENDPSFGAPVFSPCSGKVVWVQNNKLDLPVGSRDYVAVANSATIECAAGFTVVMAHFKQGSVIVNIDQEVAAGDRVAAVGNSGNTTGPHLHIMAFRQNSDGSKTPLPMVFSGQYLQKGDTVSR